MPAAVPVVPLAVPSVRVIALALSTMVEAVPARMADLGVFRSPKQQERHLQYAVRLFLRGVLPR